MSDPTPKPQAEQPRVEPEIIPPGAGYDPARNRNFFHESFSERIYVTKIGPLGMIGLVLTIGVVFAVILVLLLGAFLLWIPIVGLLVAFGLVAGILRPYLRRRG
ncbi:hypothetical protein [Rhodopseudomonas palustris]|uniref:Uncharacterized protein n=1 Tax=Rhodopseudomonas palustris (strain BisB18) TaxID=316056 RepID=Q21CQ8_RHOPB